MFTFTDVTEQLDYEVGFSGYEVTIKLVEPKTKRVSTTIRLTAPNAQELGRQLRNVAKFIQHRSM